MQRHSKRSDESSKPAPRAKNRDDGERRKQQSHINRERFNANALALSGRARLRARRRSRASEEQQKSRHRRDSRRRRRTRRRLITATDRDGAIRSHRKQCFDFKVKLLLLKKQELPTIDVFLASCLFLFLCGCVCSPARRATLAISVVITMIIIILQILLHSELEAEVRAARAAASFPVAALRDFFAFIGCRWAAFVFLRLFRLALAFAFSPRGFIAFAELRLMQSRCGQAVLSESSTLCFCALSAAARPFVSRAAPVTQRTDSLA